MSKIFEYSIVEWLWDLSQIAVYMPENQVSKMQGSYSEAVTELSKLGKDGWEVSSCTSQGNWILWTLQKEAGPAQGGRP
ncbi:MAG: hypothetical protein ACJ75J_03325 [Cytophagaceae bacterium]